MAVAKGELSAARAMLGPPTTGPEPAEAGLETSNPVKGAVPVSGAARLHSTACGNTQPVEF